MKSRANHVARFICIVLNSVIYEIDGTAATCGNIFSVLEFLIRIGLYMMVIEKVENVLCRKCVWKCH